MTNDQLYLIPNTLYNTGHTRGKPGQAGGSPGDAFRKFAKWTLKFPGNFHGNGNFWEFPEIPEVRSSFPGKTPPIAPEVEPKAKQRWSQDQCAKPNSKTNTALFVGVK